MSKKLSKCSNFKNALVNNCKSTMKIMKNIFIFNYTYTQIRCRVIYRHIPFVMCEICPCLCSK